ncbi:hypothetical protein [Myroides sp. N17-2]|uniref:hypothetical protein n=1 Tax=Myroides sp. N17-2 TaxID=2030799 RepID=UPI000EFD51FB|nr:hypothetical protein [Myroides sp. N17-2]
MNRISIKCNNCGEIVAVVSNKLSSSERDRVLTMFLTKEEEDTYRRVILQLIKLESLALILYYTSSTNWAWWGIFILCVGVFSLLQSYSVRWIYVVGLSLGIGYLFPFKVLEIEVGGWWYVIFIFLLSMLIHGMALTKDQKTFDLID